jgi:hypothetical protein
MPAGRETRRSSEKCRLSNALRQCTPPDMPRSPSTKRRQQPRRACRGYRLLLTGLWLLAAPAHPAAPPPPDAADWRRIETEGGLQLYEARSPAAGSRSLLVRAVVPVPAAVLQSVVTDYAHFAEFVPYVKTSRALGADVRDQVVYQRLRFPGPVADRHYRIDSRLSRDDKTGIVRVSWSLDGPPTEPPEGAVVPVRFSGYWELRPTAGGTSTDARYAVDLDPGGGLPGWLVEWTLRRSVLRMFEAVVTRARQTNRSSDR